MSQKTTILIVEDNPDDEALTLFALRKVQVAEEIVVVRDGQEALDYLFARGAYTHRDPQIQPDLILLDVNLPKLNGIEVLRRIRQHTSTRLIPIVMLTTSDEEQDRLRSYELYANSFIRKPVDFDKFIEIIRHIGVYWLMVNERPPLTV